MPVPIRAALRPLFALLISLSIIAPSIAEAAPVAPRMLDDAFTEQPSDLILVDKKKKKKKKYKKAKRHKKHKKWDKKRRHRSRKVVIDRRYRDDGGSDAGAFVGGLIVGGAAAAIIGSAMGNEGETTEVAQ